MTVTLVLISLLILAAPTTAATYYIDFDGGNNANAGTSTGAAWKSHPDMPSAAACSGSGSDPSYTHVAGDQFIFKGGVTWPADCFPMVISNSGTAGNVDYYGVDLTWFAGGAWTRPIFDLEFNQTISAQRPIDANAKSYWTLDNIEIRRMSLDAGDVGFLTSAIRVQSGSNVTIKNLYIHNWTLTNGVDATNSSSSFGIAFHLTTTAVAEDNTVENSANCVSDGDMSCAGSGVRGATTATGNTIHHLPNGILGASTSSESKTVRNNTIYAIRDTNRDNDHQNGIQIFCPAEISDNRISDTYSGAFGINLAPTFTCGTGAATSRIHNNVLYNVRSNNGPLTIDSSGGLDVSGQTVYIYNNTLQRNDGSNTFVIKMVKRAGDNSWLLVESKNNHYVTEGAGETICKSPTSGCGSATTLTESDNVQQTNAAANTQGYVEGNQYTPTDAGDDTVDGGVDVSGNCSGCATDINGIARPQDVAWDAGAYEWSATDPVAPAGTAPRGLGTAWLR